MIRGFANAIILTLFILVTFFGLGPVLLADGSMGERIITLVVVLAIYAILAALFLYLKRHKK